MSDDVNLSPVRDGRNTAEPSLSSTLKSDVLANKAYWNGPSRSVFGTQTWLNWLLEAYYVNGVHQQTTTVRAYMMAMLWRLIVLGTEQAPPRLGLE